MNYCDSAVVFVAREPGSDSQPLLLQNLLFSPAAAWLCRSLQLSGVERFFVVTEREFLDACAACFPQTAHILPYDHPQLNDALQAFVSVAEGKVLTFTQPVWLSFAAGQELAQAETLLPAGVPLGIYRVEPEALARDGIDAAFQGEPYAPALDAAPIALPFHTPAERNQAQYCARMDNLCRWLSLGVEMLDMNAVYIDIDAEIGSGTVLLPGTILRGRTVIGENCEIGPNSMIRDCILGNGCVANASQLNQAQFGDNVNIGPFAYVRPGSVVGDGCKVGDFVELKNSTLGQKLRMISHLFRHRGLTHTLLFPVLLTLLMMGLKAQGMAVVPELLLGFNVGWVTHIIADAFNHKGVPILWPIVRKKLHVASVHIGTWQESAFLWVWLIVTILLTVSKLLGS